MAISCPSSPALSRTRNHPVEVDWTVTVPFTALLAELLAEGCGDAEALTEAEARAEGEAEVLARALGLAETRELGLAVARALVVGEAEVEAVGEAELLDDASGVEVLSPVEFWDFS